VTDPLKYYDNNVVNTLSLLKIMLKHKVNKIIFSSTAAVYGEPLFTPIDENHPLKPVNPYGASKLMDENILSDFAQAYDISFIAFRYFCAAGATENRGESREYESHLIPVVLDQILGKRDSITVFGKDFSTVDGTGVRDYIHVEDIAMAHILGMDNFEKSKNKFYNLGTEKGYSVLEIINSAEQIINEKIKYKIGQKRPGDPAVLIASNSKANKELGWKPTKTLEDIIISSYKWRKNPKY